MGLFWAEKEGVVVRSQLRMDCVFLDEMDINHRGWRRWNIIRVLVLPTSLAKSKLDPRKSNRTCCWANILIFYWHHKFCGFTTTTAAIELEENGGGWRRTLKHANRRLDCEENDGQVKDAKKKARDDLEGRFILVDVMMLPMMVKRECIAPFSIPFLLRSMQFLTISSAELPTIASFIKCTSGDPDQSSSTSSSSPGPVQMPSLLKMQLQVKCKRATNQGNFLTLNCAAGKLRKSAAKLNKK